MVLDQVKKVFLLLSAFIFSLLVVFHYVDVGCAYGKKASDFMSENMILIGAESDEYDIFPWSIQFSKDGKRLAYAIKYNKKDKMGICVDGTCGGEWNEVVKGTPILSPDGKRVAYLGNDGKNVKLILDGKPGQGYKTINDVIFSPNSEHVLFWAEQYGGLKYVVLDNSKRIRVDEIYELIFSPDSKKIAFSARLGDKWYAFLNGKKGPAFDQVLDIKFSLDSKNFCYLGKKGLIWNLYLNGKKQKEWGARFGAVRFSIDSKRIAYAYCRYNKLDGEDGKSKLEENWYMSVDGVSGPKIDASSAFMFSPDSKHYAYVVGKPGEQYIYKDGKKVTEDFEIIRDMKFSIDSKHFTYTVISEFAECLLFVNGKKYGPYIDISVPLFGPYDHIFLYKAVIEKGTRSMIVNGKEEKTYESIGIPFFSPDGKRYAYAGRIDNMWRVVVDGKEGKPYTKVGQAKFSDGSSHIAYTAFRDNKWFLVVDGKEGQLTFDRNMPNGIIYTNADDSFNLPVIKMKGPDPEFYRLEVKINK